MKDEHGDAVLPLHALTSARPLEKACHQPHQQKARHLHELARQHPKLSVPSTDDMPQAVCSLLRCSCTVILHKDRKTLMHNKTDFHDMMGNMMHGIKAPPESRG